MTVGMTVGRSMMDADLCWTRRTQGGWVRAMLRGGIVSLGCANPLTGSSCKEYLIGGALAAFEYCLR